MYELTKIDYMKVSNLINNLNGECIFAYAVLENIQSGHIYVDNINNPNCCLIVSNGGKYLVAGDEENLNFRDILSLFLKNPNNHSNYFDLYVSSEKWLKIISGLLEDHVVKLGRSIYCYKNLNKNMFYNFKSKVPKDFVLKSMDEDLYNKYASEIDPSYRDIWGSYDQFLERGFGFCILHNGEFISVCNTFYVGHGYAEIDIMTKSEHRGQGFATITCSAFIEHCLNYELIPTWDADLGNEPSNKLALKLGFEKEKDISILWWHENAEIIRSYLTKYNY